MAELRSLSISVVAAVAVRIVGGIASSFPPRGPMPNMSKRDSPDRRAIGCGDSPLG
jgi:hypothetical protein